MQTSEARIAERSLHPSEWRARCPLRTSGDGAWASPTHATGNLCYHPKNCKSRSEAVFDIGGGFVMDDYVMEKRV